MYLPESVNEGSAFTFHIYNIQNFSDSHLSTSLDILRSEIIKMYFQVKNTSYEKIINGNKYFRKQRSIFLDCFKI